MIEGPVSWEISEREASREEGWCATRVAGVATVSATDGIERQEPDAELVAARRRVQAAHRGVAAHTRSSRSSLGLAGPDRRTDVHHGENRNDTRLGQSNQDVDCHQRHRHEKARERDEQRHQQRLLHPSERDSSNV